MNEDIKIASAIVHYVGNRVAEEGVKTSSSSLCIDDAVENVLRYYFLSPFKLEALCNFYHEAQLKMNEVYTLVSAIFEDNSTLVEKSQDIAEYLYEHSNHPKIKGGDFFVVLFKNCEVDHKIVDAIGLFKAENKERFLKVKHDKDNVSVDYEMGVNVQKLDKGCLIFNVEKEHGYVVAVVDRTKRGAEAKYWIDDFLHVVPRNDGYNQTKRAINVCKDYVKSLTENVDKNERAMMLNRLTDFLKRGDFDLKEMVGCVFDDEKTAQGFLKYNQDAITEDGNGVVEHFKTEPLALKKLSFGNLTNIKLDDNFGISIRGGEDLLEKGYDEEKGMKYYKLYFKEEK